VQELNPTIVSYQNKITQARTLGDLKTKKLKINPHHVEEL